MKLPGALPVEPLPPAGPAAQAPCRCGRNGSSRGVSSSHTYRQAASSAQSNDSPGPDRPTSAARGMEPLRAARSIAGCQTSPVSAQNPSKSIEKPREARSGHVCRQVCSHRLISSHRLPAAVTALRFISEVWPRKRHVPRPRSAAIRFKASTAAASRRQLEEITTWA